MAQIEADHVIKEMLKDAFEAVEQIWGPEGLNKVANLMAKMDRARAHNREIDQLEALINRESQSQ